MNVTISNIEEIAVQKGVKLSRKAEFVNNDNRLPGSELANLRTPSANNDTQLQFKGFNLGRTKAGDLTLTPTTGKKIYLRKIKGTNDYTVIAE